MNNFLMGQSQYRVGLGVSPPTGKIVGLQDYRIIYFARSSYSILQQVMENYTEITSSCEHQINSGWVVARTPDAIVI